jgi:hypothetical protein
LTSFLGTVVRFQQIHRKLIQTHQFIENSSKTHLRKFIEISLESASRHINLFVCTVCAKHVVNKDVGRGLHTKQHKTVGDRFCMTDINTCISMGAHMGEETVHRSIWWSLRRLSGSAAQAARPLQYIHTQREGDKSYIYRERGGEQTYMYIIYIYI